MFSYKTMAWKGLKYFLIFIAPFLATSFIDNFPQIANITIGGLLVMLINFLKLKTNMMGRKMDDSCEPPAGGTSAA